MLRANLIWVFAGIASSWILCAASSADAIDRYILISPDPAELKTNILSVGGKILTTLRYHSGFIAELAPDQAGTLRTLLSLRQNIAPPFMGVGLSARPEESEIFEKDKSFTAFETTAPALVQDDATLQVQQKTPWGVAAVRAPEAFDSTRGESATVCVIDSGVDASHPDLRGAVIGGENTIHPADETFADDDGHGTHVAGTIAARDNGFGVVGVAPRAKLFIVKALDRHGTGTFSSLAEGIRSCMAHGAQVINMSLAYTDQTETVRKAVHDAMDSGIVLVAAAGNSKGAVEYPARFPGVIAVASMDSHQQISYFSSRGPEISFIAPGEYVLSTYPDGRYAISQGTSQATPHVSGVAALLISAGIRNVAAHLRGEDLGLRPEQQGKGRIDALDSLASERF